MNIAPCAASGSRMNRPKSVPSQLMAKPNSRSSANDAIVLATLQSTRQPTSRPVTERTARAINPVARSDSVRPTSTAERAIGRVRKRSTTPLARSSATLTAVTGAGEGHALHEDAGHQVVDVVGAGHVDGRAEHVHEEQHEHDRLDVTSSSFSGT